jgi:hypothetical protein
MQVYRRGSAVTASSKRAAWEGFVKDAETIRDYNISPAELSDLSRVALLGSARSREDFIFILNVLRRARAR